MYNNAPDRRLAPWEVVMGATARTSRNILAATALGAGMTAGVAGAGALAQRRAVRRFQMRPDPFAAEPFGSLRGRPTPVRASDGTRLYAEIDGDDRSDIAVVFCHGWTLSQDSWHFQRRALRGLARLVFWDQRGHGRSDGGTRDDYSLPRLADDLRDVIEQTVPDGTPVVLVGHSMGGITVQCFLDAHPELIGERIVGTALVCTSSGGLNQVTLGFPTALMRLGYRVLPTALRAMGAGSPAIERVRHLGRQSSMLVEDFLAFGPDASPAAVAFTEQMMADTRLDALVDFLRTMVTTEVISECSRLGDIETLILCAENDRLTPVEHSLKIASLVPSAKLEIVPGSGHMPMMERPSIVSDHLGDLVQRVRTA